MREFFRHRTAAGEFRIERNGDKWNPWFEDERLMGAYITPQLALDDLAGGHTDWPSCGDPARLALPDEIGEWEHVFGR